MKWSYYGLIFCILTSNAMRQPSLPTSANGSDLAIPSSDGLRKPSGTLTHLETPRDQKHLNRLLRSFGFKADMDGSISSRTHCNHLQYNVKQTLDSLRILAGQKPHAPFEKSLLTLCKKLLKGARKFAELATIDDDSLKDAERRLRKHKWEYWGPQLYAQANTLLTELPKKPSAAIHAELTHYQRIIDAERLLEKSQHYRHPEAQKALPKVLALRHTWENYLTQHHDGQELATLLEQAQQAQNNAEKASADDTIIQALERAAASFLHAYWIAQNPEHLKQAESALNEARRIIKKSHTATPESLQRLRTQYNYTKDQSTNTLIPQPMEHSIASSSAAHPTTQRKKAAKPQAGPILSEGCLNALRAIGFSTPAETLQPCQPNEPEHNSQQHYFEYWYHRLSATLKELLGMPTTEDSAQGYHNLFATMAHLCQSVRVINASAQQLSCDMHDCSTDLSAIEASISKQKQNFFGPYYYKRGLSAWVPAQSRLHSSSMNDIMNCFSYLLMARYRMLCAQEHGHTEADELLQSIENDLASLHQHPPQDLINFMKNFSAQNNLLQGALLESAGIFKRIHAASKKADSNIAQDIINTQKGLEQIAEQLLNLCTQYPSAGLLETIEEALRKRDELEIARGRITNDPYRMNDQWNRYRECKEMLANQAHLEQ